ncbi:MAG: ABC transporter substrate-binding protein, partial [Candidatus Rokuibacteriota bacterium]
GHYRALLPLLERRGERQSIALVLFKLALALHTDLRFAEANEVYQRAFTYWSPPASSGSADATLRIGPTAVPNEADPPRSYALQNIQLQMALFDRLVERWPEATIVPSLAARWEISDDGLHYLFHLRDGLQWSDGVPLTAHDVEFGVKRNIDPDRPSPSVGIFLVLEGARDYFLRRHADLGRVGVRALDDKTVEFRLTAPAPYFMSVVNRPDAGPQPRHAIERHGDGWLAPDHQVVSGAFRLEEMSAQRVTLARRENAAPRGGNVRKVIWQALAPEEVVPSHLEGRIDIAWPAIWVAASKGAPDIPPDEIHLGPPAFLYALAIDFTDATVASTDFRRALAHAIDRDMLARMAPASLIVATGGIVPPMLQGHTPEIAPAHDPDLARRLFDRSGATGGIRVATVAGTLAPVIEAVAATWQNVLGARFEAVIVDPAEWRRAAGEHRELAPAFTFGWFPGYPDPEYFLRLLLHSDATDISSAPEARYSSGAFDELIDRAIHERDGARRLELFHAADRLAGAEEVGLIPLFYGQSAYFVKPWLQGWWEFGKSWASFGDLVISPERSATASASVP